MSRGIIDPAEVLDSLTARFGARFAVEAIESSGGSAWADDELSLRDRSMVVIACLVTLGGVESQLRGHVRWAVEQHGVSPRQVDALVTLLANYAGYPKASAAMALVRDEITQMGLSVDE